MISVRRNVFETNSSSTHSITMCSENEYDKWKNGELLFDRWNCCFVTKKEIIEKAKIKQKEFFKRKEEGDIIYHYQEKYINAKTDEELYNVEYSEEDDDTYYTYDNFWNYIEDEYETFENDYITEKGEKVIAFGYYGYDG